MPSDNAGSRDEIDCIVCSVMSINGRWYADCRSTRHGPYMSDDIATRVALSEALVHRRKRLPVRVSVQDGTGCVRAEFCLCANFKFAQS